MSETLNSGEATAPAATKVPVEISNVRPAPGQIALKAPRRAKPPKHIADFDMAGRISEGTGLPVVPCVPAVQALF